MSDPGLVLPALALCDGELTLRTWTADDAAAIGYWIHVAFVRRGLATAASRLLTDAAFSLPGISFVEIHHDKANVASAGVPRKLGFELVGEGPDRPRAPAEIGIECRWRMERAVWSGRHPSR